MTKLDDIVSISKQPELWNNAPRQSIQPTAVIGGDVDVTRLARHLLLMDPPDHRRYRSLTSARFTPRAIEPLRPGISRVVDQLLDRVAERGAEPFDFVAEVASVMPIDVIDPAHYERNGYPHAVFEKLRSEAPIAWCECEGFEPFWTVTRLDDIVSISKQPELRNNAPRQ